MEEQKRNRLHNAEAEAGIAICSIGDLYAPHTSPGLPLDDYVDPYNRVSSQEHVPLVANPSPFQCRDFCDDEYEDRKSFRCDDFDNRSQLTSNWEEANSNYSFKSYAPSRNMFQNVNKEGLMAKEALWVQLSPANMRDPNVQYHDFHAITNHSRPDWYFESMTIMRWNNRIGFMGYTRDYPAWQTLGTPSVYD